MILNAGGLLGEELTAHGVAPQSLAKCWATAVNKIRDGARVIYRETTRSVWLFAGFQPLCGCTL